MDWAKRPEAVSGGDGNYVIGVTRHTFVGYNDLIGQGQHVLDPKDAHDQDNETERDKVPCRGFVNPSPALSSRPNLSTTLSPP